MDRKMKAVAELVLQRLERFLQQQEDVDPQKCKHITATLKDIRELRTEDTGAKELVVMFDRATEEAAG